MQLDISKALKAPGEEFDFAVVESHAPEEWHGDELVFTSPVSLSGVFAATGESILLRGEVKATITVPCADCLEPAVLPVSAKVDEVFTREEDPDDPDRFTYEGHVLHLDDLVLGAILLELPMRILCRPDCKGLCPVCGANLNQTQCSCQKEMPSKQPFAALASLLNQDEEV